MRDEAGDDRVLLVLGDVGEDEARAVAGEPAGDLRPEPAAGAGDEDAAAREHHSAAWAWASSASTCDLAARVRIWRMRLTPRSCW